LPMKTRAPTVFESHDLTTKGTNGLRKAAV
jgi:hypothetical protein